jgi:hypothetical protein
VKAEFLRIKSDSTLMMVLIAGEIDSADMVATKSIVVGVCGTGVLIGARMRKYPA